VAKLAAAKNRIRLVHEELMVDCGWFFQRSRRRKKTELTNPPAIALSRASSIYPHCCLGNSFKRMIRDPANHANAIDLR
jgi:hypothetical protein